MRGDAARDLSRGARSFSRCLLLEPRVLVMSPLYTSWRQVPGALFLVAFGGVFLYFLMPEIIANFASVHWMQTSCTILSSGADRDRTVRSDPHAQETVYRVNVRYSYRVGGREFESTPYRFVDPFTDNQAAVEGAAARYSVGAVVSCYVDPADSTQAVLDRRLSPFMLIALLPGAITGLGVWSLVDVCAEPLRKRRRGRTWDNDRQHGTDIPHGSRR